MGYIGPPAVDSAIYKWNEMLMEASSKIGRDWGCARNYKRWFEEAGFEDVVERRFYWPSGPWAKGQYYKNIGAYARLDLLRALEPVSLKMFGLLGYSPEKTKEFLEGVRDDILNPKIRAYVPV